MSKIIAISISLFLTISCTKKNKTPAPSSPATPSNPQLPMDSVHQSTKYNATEDGAMFEKERLSPMDKMKMKEIVNEKEKYQSLPFDKPKAMAVFLANCSRCHGNDGKGNGPEANDLPIAPTNLKEWDLKFGSSLPDLVYTVSYGRSDNEMPRFRTTLSKDQIWLVARLVESWIAAK